jgi:hypothetical protein
VGGLLLDPPEARLGVGQPGDVVGGGDEVAVQSSDAEPGAERL